MNPHGEGARLSHQAGNVILIAPLLMRINLVLTSGQMLNNFLAKGGISDIYSPHTILA
jgi:hypothetical protein